jgi:hypothetical protein
LDMVVKNLEEEELLRNELLEKEEAEGVEK